MIKPLLGVLNPRDLPEFKECVEKINIDRLHIKYFQPESDAYDALRKSFLKHTEYSHLIICPDDIVFDNSHIEKLISGIEQFNFPILTGYANLDLKHPDTYSVSLYPIDIIRERRNPILLTKQTMPTQRYIEVKWCGFGLTTIRRNIVEKIQFEDDSRDNNRPYGSGCCVDTKFSWDALCKRIPMICDTTVKFLHLRKDNYSLMDHFYAGIKPRAIQLFINT